MTIQRGDIVLAIFPDSSRRTGKPRPALVIQANDLKTGLAQTVVAMITSNLSRDRVIGIWGDMTVVDAALRHTLGI